MGTGSNIPVRLCIAISLLSLSALALEISLIRILSVVNWYHFAFMVVSIALFGYGAAGALLSLLPFLRESRLTLPLSAGSCSLTILLSLFFSAFLRFDPIRAHASSLHVLVIIAQYVLLGLPFLFSGVCLATVISRYPERSSVIYFSDLTGAGLGCLMALSLLPLGGPLIPISAAASAAALACAVLSHLGGWRVLTYLSAISAAALLVFGVTADYDPEISDYKALSAALRSPGSERVWSSWNAISRVDVIESKTIRHAPGLPFDVVLPLPEQMGLTVDGDNLEPITRYEGELAKLGFMVELPSSVPYYMNRPEGALIIDAGAGFDVLKALANGVGEIHATEQNPNTIRAVGREFEDFSGDLYSHPGIEVSLGDARSFLASSNRSFDIIEISLKQDPVTSSTGMYSLSENYLFTVEAFGEMLSRLSEDGILTLTRWLSPPPRQEARVVSLMIGALEGAGVDDPGLHVACYRSYLTLTLIMKRTPLDSADVSYLRRACEERGFDLVYLPGISEGDVNRYNLLDEPYYYRIMMGLLNETERESLLDRYIFDLRAPTDDRPFFFDFLKLTELGRIADSLGPAWNPYLEGGLLIIAVLVQSSVVSSLFIVIPLCLSSRIRRKWSIEARWLLYFLLLGGAYMLIEVTFLQRLILYLGQPAYAMAGALFAMLVFSGLGSLWSGRYPAGSRFVALSVVGICLLLLFHILVFDLIVRSLLGLHIWLKFLISLGLISPIAFLMGIPFPTGLRILGTSNRDALPLAYGANACASVVGSAGAMVLASWVGFDKVMVVALVLYIAAYAAVSRSTG